MIKKYRVLIKDSEDNEYDYAYIIECEDTLLLETEFNKIKNDRIENYQDTCSEEILDEMVEKKIIKSCEELKNNYDLTFKN